MRTVIVNLYKFEELSDEAKEHALAKYGDFNVDDEWWENLYEDAENIGIRIQEFNDVNLKGDFINDPIDVAKDIIRNHGYKCETYKTAQEFMLSDQTHLDEKEFLYSLQEDYRILLNKEYEYLTSDEQVAETLISNEYDFTVKGEIY